MASSRFRHSEYEMQRNHLGGNTRIEEPLDFTEINSQVWKFKFSKGIVQQNSKIGIRKRTFAMSSLLKIIITSGFYNLIRITNIISIFKLISIYLINSIRFEVTNPTYYFSVLFLSIFLSLAFNLFYYFQARNLLNRWSASKSGVIKRLKKNKKWADCPVNQLTIGSVIKVEVGQVCPADILVLDTRSTNMDRIILINERKITGINRLTRKYPVKDPKEFGGDLRENLTGYIEYLEPNCQFGSAIGVFKLKGDPKLTLIKPSNTIFAGSKIVSDPIIGLVLYTGSDTKVFQQALKSSKYLNRRKFLQGSISKGIDRIIGLFLALSLSTSFFLMLYYYQHQDIKYDRIKLIEKVMWERPDWQRFVQILSIVTSLIPVYLSVLQDIILFFWALKIQTISKKNTKKSCFEELRCCKKQKKDENESHKQNSTRLTTETLPLYLGTDPPKENPIPNNGASSPPNNNLIPGRFSNLKKRSRLETNKSRNKITFLDTNQEKEHFESIQGILNIPSSRSIAVRHSEHEIYDQSGLKTSTKSFERKNANEAKKEAFLSYWFNSAQNHELPNSKLKKKGLKALKSVKSVHETEFKVSADSWAKATNHLAISDLGNIDHVIFDKTDTLTDDKIQISFLSTFQSSYNLDLETINLDVENYLKNPEMYKEEEDLDDDNIEDYDGFYSEKSQEYTTELEKQWDSKLFDEDPDFETDVIDKIQIPSFMPQVNHEKRRMMKEMSSNTLGGLLGAESSSADQQGEDTEFKEQGSPLRTGSRLSTKQQTNFRRSFSVRNGSEDSKKKSKGLNISRIEKALMSGRRGTTLGTQFGPETKLLAPEDDYSMQDEEDSFLLSEKINTFRSQFSFFHDVFSDNREIDFCICTLAMFLYCGMVDLAHLRKV